MQSTTKHFIFLLVLIPCQLFCQPELFFQTVTLSGGDLTQPVDIENAGDGTNRLFIVEKRGTIRIIENGAIQSGFFLDIQSQVHNSGERGLLGMVFHPQFPDSAYVYINYVAFGNTTHIARFSINPSDPADLLESSEKTILTVSQPYNNHNAGDLAFGPDGYLYVGLGDGGNGGDPENRSQNGGVLLGKMLRIDIDTDLPYLIPPSNPYLSDPNVLDEIWALGLRNPWRFSFDAVTNDMWIADVGQNIWEEITIQPANSTGGENYGWDCYEASAEFEIDNCDNVIGTVVPPIFEYPHDDEIPEGWNLGNGNSITGGFVYRGSNYPALEGFYVCADFSTNFAWAIRAPVSGELGIEVYPFDLGNAISLISSFGETESNELYAVGLDGTFYEVGATDTPLAIDGLTFQAKTQGARVLLNWQIIESNPVLHYALERAGDGEDFKQLVSLDFRPGAMDYQDQPELTGHYFYRLKVVYEDGGTEYSHIEQVYVQAGAFFKLLGNTGSAPTLEINGHSQELDVHIFDVSGKLMSSRTLNQSQVSRYHDWFDGLVSGIYVIKVSDGTGVQTDRFLIK